MLIEDAFVAFDSDGLCILQDEPFLNSYFLTKELEPEPNKAEIVCDMAQKAGCRKGHMRSDKSGEELIFYLLSENVFNDIWKKQPYALTFHESATFDNIDRLFRFKKEEIAARRESGSNTLVDAIIRANGEKKDPCIFTNEINMIFRLVLGCTLESYKTRLQIPEKVSLLDGTNMDDTQARLIKTLLLLDIGLLHVFPNDLQKRKKQLVRYIGEHFSKFYYPCYIALDNAAVAEADSE